MIKSKKLKEFKNIKHGFFNSIGGVSSGIYKSLNCGLGSKDTKKNVIKVWTRNFFNNFYKGLDPENELLFQFFFLQILLSFLY